MLRLSNLDKPFWPEEGITKGDLLALLPRGRAGARPAPEGPAVHDEALSRRLDGKFFFQKDAPKHMPDWIPTRGFRSRRASRRGSDAKIQAPLVNDELALLWMVNMGCIDLNTWYSRIDKPDRPDFVLFDLDPSPDVGFAETVRSRCSSSRRSTRSGSPAFPKTSGSDGMHVLVPIDRRYTYDDTREFAEIVAGAIARAHPRLVTTEWTKAKRRGVLIDANQNGEGKTIASVYSVRPKPGAPVSTPLRWEEVNEALDPAAFTMDAVLERVERDGDLFEGVLTTKQSLGARAQGAAMRLDDLVARARRLLPRPRGRERRLGARLRDRLRDRRTGASTRARVRGPLERPDGARHRRRRARGDVRLPERPDRRGLEPRTLLFSEHRSTSPTSRASCRSARELRAG